MRLKSLSASSIDIFSTKGYYFIKDKIYHVIPSDLVFIDVNCIHKTSSVNNLKHERILINFKDNFLSDFVSSIKDIDKIFKNESNIMHFDLNTQQYIESLLYKMLNEYYHRNEGWEVSLKILLLEFLITMNRNNKNLVSNSFQFPNALHQKVSQIASFINTNYSDPITLSIIAENFNISRWYLSRNFKKITGFSIIEYLNRIRIKEAEILLKTTNYTIGKIASQVDFDNYTHFTRVFKSFVGISPSKYRSQYKKVPIKK